MNILNNKNLIQLLKLCVAKNNPKEALNYAFYDCDNKKLIASDTTMLMIVHKVDLEEYDDNTLIAIHESKKRLLTVKIDDVYPDYQRIIPTSNKQQKSYNTLFELLQDDSLFFPYYNKNLHTFLTKVGAFNKDTTYSINSHLYQISGEVDDYKYDLITMPVNSNFVKDKN